MKEGAGAFPIRRLLAVCEAMGSGDGKYFPGWKCAGGCAAGPAGARRAAVAAALRWPRLPRSDSRCGGGAKSRPSMPGPGPGPPPPPGSSVAGARGQRGARAARRRRRLGSPAAAEGPVSTPADWAPRRAAARRAGGRRAGPSSGRRGFGFGSSLPGRGQAPPRPPGPAKAEPAGSWRGRTSAAAWAQRSGEQAPPPTSPRARSPLLPAGRGTPQQRAVRNPGPSQSKRKRSKSGGG